MSRPRNVILPWAEYDSLITQLESYRTALAVFMFQYLHETDTHIWETCHQEAWLVKADEYITDNKKLIQRTTNETYP